MLVNERNHPWSEGLTLAIVRQQVKPDADLVILNGFPIEEALWKSTPVAAADSVVLIKRGEIPSCEELARLRTARHPPGVAARLAAACVGIGGLGGLGSHVAHALARLGVGGLVLVDFDVVEPSNLNRQVYNTQQIGRPKADALREDLLAVNPSLQIRAYKCRLTAAAVGKIFQCCRAIVECLDRPEEKQMLVETALRALPEAAVIAASGLAGTGEANAIRTRRVNRRFWVVGDEISAAQPGVGLMAPRVMVAAGHQAVAVMRLLLDEVE